MEQQGMEMGQAVPRDTLRLVQLLFALLVCVTTQDVLCRKVWGVFLELYSCKLCTLLLILELKGWESI